MSGINSEIKVFKERRQVWVKHANFDYKKCEWVNDEPRKGYFHGFVIQDQGIVACKTPGKCEIPYGIIELENGEIKLLELEAWKFADTKSLMNEEIWEGDDNCGDQVPKDSSGDDGE